MTSLAIAQTALSKIITKSRVHLYKPIQLAEILYRDRVVGDINLNELESYRSPSKRWRDIICDKFLGRRCTSSSKFQDNLFDKNAMPPDLLTVLGSYNKENNGIVEAYIYNKFKEKHFQLNSALDYCLKSSKNSFNLSEFIGIFWEQAGLKRSLDKIFEIVVYSLFETIIEHSGLKISISVEDENDILGEFHEFAEKVVGIDKEGQNLTLDAHFHRVGVTNAADRGLDIFANFGAVIQVKHLSLSERLAEDITNSITASRIVIVCKDVDLTTIRSLLTQIGWRSRIQAIISIEELDDWYSRALTGKFNNILGDDLLNNMREQIQLEFPSVGSTEFEQFLKTRDYNKFTTT